MRSYAGASSAQLGCPALARLRRCCTHSRFTLRRRGPTAHPRTAPGSARQGAGPPHTHRRARAYPNRHWQGTSERLACSHDGTEDPPVQVHYRYSSTSHRIPRRFGKRRRHTRNYTLGRCAQGEGIKPRPWGPCQPRTSRPHRARLCEETPHMVDLHLHSAGPTTAKNTRVVCS